MRFIATLAGVLVIMAACFVFCVNVWTNGHHVEAVVVGSLMLFAFFSAASYHDNALRTIRQLTPNS